MSSPEVHHLFHAPIADHSFTGDRKTIAVARDNNVELYSKSGNDFKLIDELRGHDKTVTGVDIAPRSGRIVTCSQGSWPITSPIGSSHHATSLFQPLAALSTNPICPQTATPMSGSPLPPAGSQPSSSSASTAQPPASAGLPLRPSSPSAPAPVPSPSATSSPKTTGGYPST